MEQFVLKVGHRKILNAKILPDRLSAKYKTLEKYRVYGNLWAVTVCILVIEFLGGQVVARKPYLMQTLRLAFIM